MIHVQHSEKQRLDMARFNEAFMMHTSTSPQYGIIASCDVAAAMMEQPAGRALVQETIDEALSFRRAMTAVQEATERFLVVRRLAARGDGERSRPTTEPIGCCKPGDRWHGFEGLPRTMSWSIRSRSRSSRPGLSAERHACRSTAFRPRW